jgi:transcriptional regulator with XRE-family HTH domain
VSYRHRKPVHPLIELLATARTRRGISLTAAAHRLGTTRQTLHEWETGVHEPRLSKITDYARALGYDLQLAPRKHGGAR